MARLAKISAAPRIDAPASTTIRVPNLSLPKGLTLVDLQQLGEVGMAHITARQELREMIGGLSIPEPGEIAPIAAAG